MGKSLKRKECGKGIRQRKDGLYSARYYTKDGERREKYFKSLPEAKNWLADTKYELRHRVITCNSDMSVLRTASATTQNAIREMFSR